MTREILETAVEAGSFKTLAAALAAGGLVETLKSKGPFTVFAPTDDTFAKLPKGTVEDLLKPEKIIDYMFERGGSPAIPATKAPKTKYASPLEAMKNALGHEHGNTTGIYACLKVATEADDPATTEMLQWFVKEQVEEEQWAEEYAQMVEKIEKSIGGMYAFDHRVGSRVNA